MKSTFFTLAISSASLLADGFNTYGITLDTSPDKSAPYFTLSGGMMWRNIGKTNVSPNFAGGPAFFTPPGGVGPATAPGNRTYDNGFVNIGAATPITGLTTNFGYTAGPPQVGDNLVFTRTGGAAVGFPSGGSDDADLAPAPYLDFSFVIPANEDLKVGFNMNFAFTGLDGRFGSNVALYSVTTVDTYALNGVIPPAGNYSGPFGGAAPLIPNVPTSRQQDVAQTGTGKYQFQQDTDLYSLALGADIRWTPAEKFSLGVGAGMVLNIADWEAGSSNPALNPATAAIFQNVASSEGCDALFGLYLEASAVYQINRKWSVESFLRYDWTEDLDASAGATDFSVDLSGLSIGTGVTYRF